MAGAAGADDDAACAGGDVHIAAAQDIQAPEALVDVYGAEHGVSHRAHILRPARTGLKCRAGPP